MKFYLEWQEEPSVKDKNRAFFLREEVFEAFYKEIEVTRPA